MTEVIPPRATDLSEDRLLPIVVYGLYILGIASFGGSILIGLIVAYANLADAGPRNFSHYRFAIRSFWLSIAWFLIGGSLVLFGGPLSLVLIGLPFLGLGLFIWWAISIWFTVRAVVGLIYVAKGEAYPRPKTWLI
jgi:uncharacterized membrane protein